MEPTVKRFASGKYHVYIGGDRLPCVIVGGNGKFNLESGGKFLGRFRTARAAAKCFVEESKRRGSNPQPAD